MDKFAFYNQVCGDLSELVTKRYTTSFYYGIQSLDADIQQPIYDIYGFVRFADEIVDSFHHTESEYLITEFIEQTWQAIELKISTNPILQRFQNVYHKYNLEQEEVELFFQSMKMDLSKKNYDTKEYRAYILGSAEVVGLMCLHVFCDGNTALFHQLKPGAMQLGSAFQKINFLRDIKADVEELGRSYFPDVDLTNFTTEDKQAIEREIDREFQGALESIRQLPTSAKRGVYTAWLYYYGLLKKIKRLSPEIIQQRRVRISNFKKFQLMLKAKWDCKTGKV